MKFFRFGRSGHEKVGAVASDGSLRDLSSAVPHLHLPDMRASQWQALLKLKPENFPAIPKGARLGVPYTGISKFIGIGLNYRDHAIEAGLPIPTEPILFMKATTCISGPQDPVIMPPDSTKLDWEVELGVVIGKEARRVSEAQALNHVAGYTVVNDISERAWQMERGGTWDKGKCADTFGPIGPWLVTRDEVPNPQALELWLDINGTPRQRGHTSTMIFGVAHLVHYLSHFMTLLPGDIVCTGTPPGVGMGHKPPVWLQRGDVMTLGIAGLGQQRQQVV